MSEFQYDEWIAIERRLSASQLKEVEALSSHMDWVTPSGASVTYQWGDFKHDPIAVLRQYFDAFLYTSNWGTHRLAFRFGHNQIDPDAFTPYLLGDLIDLEKIKTDHIFSIEVSREAGSQRELPQRKRSARAL